jgi:hypothetical protein
VLRFAVIQPVARPVVTAGEKLYRVMVVGKLDIETRLWTCRLLLPVCA